MSRKPAYPLLRVVMWAGENRIRAFFSTGRVVEVALPWVKCANRARVVDDGGGLDPGNGKDVGADTVYALPGRVLLRGSAL